MPRVRSVALGGLVILTVGSLATTLGYAWYWRSERYRYSCAHYLSQALGLPSDIARIVPRSWNSREFDDVNVWLPGRRSKALSCRRALLVYTPRPDDSNAYEIDLLGGTAEVSTRSWLREDYRRVIESGLRPGFNPAGPRCVKFSDMDLRFERNGFRGRLEGASGMVVFDGPQHAWTAVRCQALNGYEAAQPALLNARFSPRTGGIQIDQLELTVPNLPLSVLDLRSLVGAAVRSGAFNGRLGYGETADNHRFSLSGTCSDVSLAECTAGLLPHPWRGTCPELQLDELSFENGRWQRLRFRGVLSGVVLGDVLAPWGLQDAGGEVTLRIRDADLSPAGIVRLVASGECAGVSLARLTEKTDLGRMSGTARLVIDDLTIEDNRLRSLEAHVRVEETGEPKWIEGRLVTGLIGRVLNMQVPPILPERIDYTQLGFRLDVRDEVVYLFGTHGSRDKTILTVRLYDRELPLIVEPEYPFELGVWLDRLRAEGAAYLQAHLDELSAQRLREALHSRASRGATSTPGSPGAPEDVLSPPDTAGAP